MEERLEQAERQAGITPTGDQIAENLGTPKQQAVRDITYSKSAITLMDDQIPYQANPSLSLEERVEKLEAALRAIQDTIANL